MSISFTQSMQSLHADRGQSALWGMGITSLFLLLWLIWFLTPSLTIYAHGHVVKLTRSGTIVAEIAVEESTHLQVGQAAYVHSLDAPLPQQRIKASVSDIAPRPTAQNQIQITLYPMDTTDIEEYFANGVTGDVQVEVETISPAVMLLRTLGQWDTSQRVSVSPQTQP